MAHYTVMMSCGHEETVELLGKGSDRERKIEYFKSEGLCKECYKEKMEEKAKQEGLNFNASVLPYIEEDDGSIMLSVWFSGDTRPYKDDIKALGGYKWSERESAADSFSLKRPPLCWNKVIKQADLDSEVEKAVSIGAKNLATDSGLFAMVDYQIALDKQKKWKDTQEKIAALEKPKCPNVLKGHRWNQKVYGKEGNYSIYPDNVKTMITDDEAAEIEIYLAKKEEYNNKVGEIKKEVATL